MSEKILKALMQLFAIIAEPESNSDNRQLIIESFLKQQLNKQLVTEYLEIYNYFFDLHQKKQSTKTRRRKRMAASSVKVLMIGNVINQELTYKQKVIVIIQLLEFINIENSPSEQEIEFVSTLTETFHIPNNERVHHPIL